MFRIRLSKEHIKELNNKNAVVFDTGMQIVEIKADFPITLSNMEVTAEPLSNMKAAADAKLIDEIDRLRRKVDVLTQKYIEILDEDIGSSQGYLLPEVIKTSDKIRLQWGLGRIHDKEERGGITFCFAYGTLVGIDIPRQVLREVKEV